MHGARLPPGASITVRVPPRGLVRVAASSAERAIGDVQFWVSDGSGLYREVIPAVSAADQSLVVAPNLRDAGLLRIERPCAADCAVFLAVFTSRRINLESADSFLTPVTPSGPTVELSLDGSPQRRVWGWLRPGQPTQVTVCGPARLRLDTRLQYAVGESSARQAYRLQISVDGEAPRILELETSSESRHVVSINGIPRVVGRSEVEYLDLPPGNHQVTLTSTACLYLHVLSTSLTSNVIPAAFHAGEPLGIAPDSWQSLWQRPNTTYARLLQQERIDLHAYRAAALRSARDNRYREGGLRAWWLLQTLSAGHPELKDLHRWAERTGQFHTRYRNLLPVRHSVPVRLRTAWCTPRSLRTMDAEPVSTVLAEQFVQDAIDKLCRAHFVRFPAQQSAEATYRLPEQLGPTQLRILVGPSCPSDGARMWLSIDEHPPVALRTMGQPSVLETEMEPTKAEVGLAAQYWREPQFDAGTLGGPFAMRRAPARWIPVGVAEWTLPHGRGRSNCGARTPRENRSTSACSSAAAVLTS